MEKLPEDIQLSSYYEDVPAGICKTILDEDLTILYANERYYQIFGYTREEAIKAGFTSVRFIVPEGDFPRVLATARQNVHDKQYDYSVEAREKKKNGEWIWVISNTHIMADGRFMLNTIIDITERKTIEEKLKMSEVEYQVAAEQSHKFILHYDIVEKRLTSHFLKQQLWNGPSQMENVPESILNSGYLSPESNGEFNAFFYAIRQGEPHGNMVIQMRTMKGDFRWFHADFTNVFDEEHNSLFAVISMYDVTDEREKILAYERFCQAEDTLPLQSIMQYEVNLTRNICERERGERLPSILSVSDASYTEIFSQIRDHNILRQDRNRFGLMFGRDNLIRLFSNGERNAEDDFRLTQKGKKPAWIHVRAQMVTDPYSYDIKAFITFEDIDEKKQEELRLKHLSKVDPLTGLLNRSALEAELDEIIRRSNSSDQHAFIIIDIDNFKKVNDTCGHLVGDRILRDVSSRLRSLVREGDLLARLGGDEFVLVLRNIPFDTVIEKRADLICQIINTRVENSVEVSGSMGIALFPKDGDTFNELYRKADIALYEAKRQGRNTRVFYKPDQNYEVTSQITPVDDLEMVQNAADQNLSQLEMIQRKNAALISQQNEDERYRILLGGSDAVILDWNVENDACYSSANFERYQLSERSVSDFFNGDIATGAIHADDEALAKENFFSKVKKGVDSAETAFRIARKDGNYVWIRVNGVFVRDTKKKLKRVVCMFNEIDFVREKADIQLEALFNNIEGGIGIFAVGKMIRPLFLNPGFLGLSGKTGTDDFDYTKQDITQEILTEDREIFEKGIREAIKGQKSTDVMYRLKRPDGKLAWHHMRATRIPYEGCSDPVFIATINDVTELKENEERACLAMDQLHLLVNTIPGGLAVVEVKENAIRELYRSDGVAELYGMDKAEYDLMAGDNFAGLVAHEFRKGLFEAFRQSEKEGCSFEYTFRTDHSQDEKWILLRGAPIHYKKGMLQNLGMIEPGSNREVKEPDKKNPVFAVIQVDISGEKHLEKELLKSSQRNEIAFDLTSADIWEYDVASRTGTISQAMLERSPYPATMIPDFCETTISSGLIHGDSEKNFRYLFTQIHNGVASDSCTVKMRQVNNRFAWVRLSYHSIFDETGHPQTAIGINEVVKFETD